MGGYRCGLAGAFLVRLRLSMQIKVKMHSGIVSGSIMITQYGCVKYIVCSVCIFKSVCQFLKTQVPESILSVGKPFLCILKHAYI